MCAESDNLLTLPHKRAKIPMQCLPWFCIFIFRSIVPVNNTKLGANIWVHSMLCRVPSLVSERGSIDLHLLFVNSGPNAMDSNRCRAFKSGVIESR